MKWLDNVTDSTNMNLSKLWETVEDRGAWRAVVLWSGRVGQDLVTKQQQQHHFLVIIKKLMIMRKILSISQRLKTFQDHSYLSSHLLLTAALCKDRLGVTITTWKMQNLDRTEFM